MYVHRIKAGDNDQYQSALLRESYRVGDKIRNRTLANLSKLPPATVDLIDGHLKGKQYTDLNEALPNPIRSLAHGAIMAIETAMKALGFQKLVHYRNTRERKLVIAMIAGCLLRPHYAESGLARSLQGTTLLAELGIEDATEDDFYAAMDWLADRQRAIEKRLVKRWLGTGSRVFYDLTSVWMEGKHCPLAEYGYSRDGKRGKKQVNFGLVCDDRGRPVSLSVHAGNITDPETIMPEIERLHHRYGLETMTVVGDRGMIVKATTRALQEQGLDWITALKGTSIRALVRKGFIDPGDERDLFVIERCPNFPGERLVACRNPALAERRRRTREDLLAVTEEDLARLARKVRRGTLKGASDIGVAVGRVVNRCKMAKHFDLSIGDDSLSWQRREGLIAIEASLDGITIIRTSLSSEDMSAVDCVRSYKSLTRVERAFRSCKISGLRVRPVHHRLSHRVRAHIFIHMLTYLVEWHMREAWKPLLFADTDIPVRDNPVSPAVRSKAALKKVRSGKQPDGSRVYCFRSLLEHMDTIVRNTHPIPGGYGATIETTTEPDEVHKRALELLEGIAEM